MVGGVVAGDVVKDLEDAGGWGMAGSLRWARLRHPGVGVAPTASVLHS